MKLKLILCLALVLSGGLFGCTTERDTVQPVATQKGGSEGLEFLADIPSLKGVSLRMSDADFLDILRRQKLAFTRGIAAGQTAYYVQPKAGAVVIFMFRDGHCSGIQRGTEAGF